MQKTQIMHNNSKTVEKNKKKIEEYKYSRKCKRCKKKCKNNSKQNAKLQKKKKGFREGS